MRRHLRGADMEREEMRQDRKETKNNATLAPERELIDAKEQFLKNANNFKLLGFVGKRPVTSLGCAFLLGFGLTHIGLDPKKLPVLSMALETGNLLLRYGLSREKDKGARGSGG